MFDTIRSKPSRIIKFTAFEIDFIFCEIEVIDFVRFLVRLINTYNLNKLLVIIVG
jgi:hypothetical protein